MRRSPLARTGFKRKLDMPFTSLERKSAMKSRRKRVTVAEGSRFIDACRGEECYLRVPGVCISLGWAHPSVVDCHSNQQKHGKGAGLKARHQYTVPGCSACHEWLDRSGALWEVKVLRFDTALSLWVPVRTRKLEKLK